MWKAKYIIDEYERPIVFSELFNHIDVCVNMRFDRKTILGAGFVYVNESGYHCYGESISLGVESRGDVDSAVLNRYLNGAE